ncbi:MAG: hypothetical protein SO434_03235 [Eubacteriales bacterium]|nr:hypothetical protein [Eubacteriales bacterium]
MNTKFYGKGENKMFNSKNLIRKNVLIGILLCIVFISLLLPVYAQEETIERSILDLSYEGSTNKVYCELYAQGEVITFSTGLIRIKGLNKISIKKTSQSILLGQTVQLNGNVKLKYNNNGSLVQIDQASISRSFNYKNTGYDETLFDHTCFTNEGEYYLDVNLTFTRGSWTTSYNELIKIDYYN